jgi:hypothetical protein
VSERIFHMDDCVVTLPPGFVDRTINVLEWQAPGGEPVVLAVQRERLLTDLAFDDYVDLETKGYPSKFGGFKQERDDSQELPSGIQVRRKSFRWKRERDVVYNHQAFVHAGESVIVFTASAKAQDRDEVDRLIDDALGTIKFREV